MEANGSQRFRRAPWGRRKFLVPLPILSVLVMAVALAAPNLAHITVTVVDDSHLTMVATVQNVVHPTGPTGKLVGIVTVTNHGADAIQITNGTATIAAVAGGFNATVGIQVPLVVGAGSSVTVSFSAPFDGAVTNLQLGDSFLVTPLVTWFTLTASGPVGPFTYATAKTCTTPTSLDLLGTNDWNTMCS